MTSGRELLAELDDEVAHPLAAGPRRRPADRAVGRRAARATAPAARRSGRRPPAGSVERGPDRRQVLGAEPGLGGEVRQRRLRLAEGRAVLEPPGGQEVVGVVGPLPLVEIDDPPHAILVAVGVGDAPGAGRRRARRGFRTRWSATRRAASRYFFTRAGDIASDSAELSKPASLAGSTGNSRVGRMSTPVRSRIVWSYSALLSRRARTGPGSPAFRVASCLRTASIQSMTSRRSLGRRAAASPSPAASSPPRAAPGPAPSARRSRATASAVG